MGLDPQSFLLEEPQQSGKTLGELLQVVLEVIEDPDQILEISRQAFLVKDPSNPTEPP